MDKFWESFKLPKLTQEEIENWNRSIINKETKLVIKNLPTKTNSSPESFTGEFYLIFTEVIQWFTKSSRK